MILERKMKMFDAMKLKKVSEDDIEFLYDMLKERDSIENYLHKEMPPHPIMGTSNLDEIS